MYLAPGSSSQSTHRYNKSIVYTCSYLLILCLFYPTTYFAAETKTAAGLQHKLKTLQEVIVHPQQVFIQTDTDLSALVSD